VADKNEKGKKPNAIKSRFVNSIGKWWRETIGELRKVSWPTMAEARRLTGIVLIVLLAMSILLGIFDFIFSRIIQWMIA
jgi:preprotein translocase subunit SecE